MANINRLSTTRLSTTLTQGTASGVASSGVIGDFSELGIGARTGLTVEAFRGESTAASKLQVVFRIYARADVQVFRPNAFSAIVGMIA